MQCRLHAAGGCLYQFKLRTEATGPIAVASLGVNGP